jgi:serine/threonine protein kinase
MNPQRWQAVGELFDGALAVAAEERQVWIERACEGDDEVRSEVLSLLASYDAKPGGFVQHRIKSALDSFCATNPAAPPPIRVGPYRFIRELGRGGMGAVFLAERDDKQYHSQVAIKLVRTGMDTEFIFARFRRERQTLARLQHPNIARLLDGGTTENGLPYIVMEYIDGPSLTRYAKQHQLEIPDRLRLFASVCTAVDYAHRNFVIHRDVKPGNILVGSDGIPKLLDFGICKLLQADVLSAADTTPGLHTPDYASPEQMSGKAATPMSDIYSLGVVLYELLTGVIPRDSEGDTPQAMGHTHGARPITLPSAAVRDNLVARQLSGDLDNIVMHALEAEPERRYESAAQLSEDLHRHLSNEPVHARPLTRGYRTLKFIRRNRVRVVAASAVVLALAAGLAVSVHQARLAHTRLREVYQSLVDQQIGDSLTASHDLQAAKQAYSESADTAESCMKAGQAECLILYIQSSYKLAQNAVALGHREVALEFVQRALRASEAPPAGTASRLASARAVSAIGLTYAALSKSPLREPGDIERAQRWLGRSVDAWHAAQSDPWFSVDHQREMKEVEEALYQIDR